MAASSAIDPVPTPRDLLRPRASSPWVDEKIVWANLTVKHHATLDRNEKIRVICDYLKSDDLTLRVCLRSKLVDGCLNDNVCEKCLRTIAAITLAGGDPEKCGFHVDESTFKRMRHYWEKINPLTPRNQWRQIQSMVPELIENDIHGSKEFFEWFRGFDFEASKKNYFYRDLYTSIPYVVAKYLDKIYQKYGINIHESPDKRE